MNWREHRRQKEKEYHVDSDGTWAISYGDMITLLLAFFVMFFTLDPQKSNESQMQELLLTELKKSADVLNESDETASSFRQSNISVGEDSDREKNLTPEVVKNWGGKVYKIGYRIIVEFPNISFFKTGYIDVNHEGLRELEHFAKIYTPFAGKYILGIRAFTDSRKVLHKDRYRDNLELSALRSISAMRALRKFGIPLERMRLGGYGELKTTQDDLIRLPADQRSDSMALSRKVVLVIEPEAKREENS
ncbi:MAG: hypothetical protein KDD61_16535 [Bdellovibrionales bacterium]|nr:hypothetical protein [Bdellovibrionales bacterium]